MYGQGGFGGGGFNQPNQGFNQPNQGFNQGGFNQPNQGFNQGGFNQPQGFNQGGFNQPQGFNQGGFNQPQGFNQGGFGSGPRDAQIFQVVSQLFPMYDQNRSGCLSAHEVGPFFTAALSQLGETYAISNGQASLAIKQCDYNQDGQLTPQECANALKFIVSNSSGAVNGQWNYNAGMNTGGFGGQQGFQGQDFQGQGQGRGQGSGHPGRGRGRGGW